jgi:uncharacterized phage infection (PIP) family protein YhgE
MRRVSPPLFTAPSSSSPYCAKERFFKSLQPQEHAVHCQVENVKSSLFELHAWTTVFLHQRVGQLAEGNTELLQGKEALLKGNQELLNGKNELLQNTEQLKNENTRLLQEVAELKRANGQLLQKVVELESNLKGQLKYPDRANLKRKITFLSYGSERPYKRTSIGRGQSGKGSAVTRSSR